MQRKMRPLPGADHLGRPEERGLLAGNHPRHARHHVDIADLEAGRDGHGVVDELGAARHRGTV